MGNHSKYRAHQKPTNIDNIGVVFVRDKTLSWNANYNKYNDNKK